ncbi:hypothetical protein ACJX0J_039849, partial [Zea mays]
MHDNKQLVMHLIILCSRSLFIIIGKMAFLATLWSTATPDILIHFHGISNLLDLGAIIMFSCGFLFLLNILFLHGNIFFLMFGVISIFYAGMFFIYEFILYCELDFSLHAED